MIKFKVRYYNVDLNHIKEKLEESLIITNEINHIIANLASLSIAGQISDLKDIKRVSNSLAKNKEIIVVLGTGGSNLGARALINILQGGEVKKIHFFDNIDPIQFRNSILKLDMLKTGFIIISKSGHTPETLSQFSSIIEIIKLNNFSQECLKDFVVVTENKESPLKKIANQFSCQTLDHSKNIGGRYSVFSNVGLLPASIAGMDILKIRLGADEIISKVKNDSYKDHLIGSKLIISLQSKRSVNLNVLMTYTDALYYF